MSLTIKMSVDKGRKGLAEVLRGVADIIETSTTHYVACSLRIDFLKELPK